MSLDGALASVASCGLPGGAARGDAGVLHPAEVYRLVSVVQHQRIEGLLVAAVDEGAVSGPRLAELAHDAHHEILAVSLAAEEGAILALDALRASGLQVRLLKGLASAHLDYPDPSLRVFADADLLVQRRAYGSALAALTAAGFRRTRPPVRSWWEQRYSKAVVMHTPVGGELDLHMSLAGGYFGELFDHDRLWTRTGSGAVLAGRPVLALCPELRLLHACFHTILGDHSGLRSRRDVAQLILMTDADWEQTVDQAAEFNADAVIATAVRETWTALRLADHPASDWANAHPRHPEQARAIQSYRETFATEWGPEGLSALPAMGTLDRARYMTGLAFPSGASLAARDRGRLDHVWHGLAVFKRRH